MGHRVSVRYSFFKKIFTYSFYFLAVVSLVAALGLFLAATSEGYSLVVVRGPLVAGACCGAQALGPVIVAHGLSYSSACGVFRDQEANWCPLQGGFLTTRPPGKP